MKDGSYNLIGGTVLAARNVISGNAVDGVKIWALAGEARDNQVLGNFIGTDQTGSFAVANAGVGIHLLRTAGTVIGGTSGAERNVISGNRDRGIRANQSSNTLVLGNYIGTDRAVEIAVPNAGGGVNVKVSTATRIGSTAIGAGNVISGNDWDGVLVTLGGSNWIQGNWIGTTLNGETALGNGRCGVFIEGSPDNLIGGTTPESANVIAANAGAGIALRDTSSSQQATRNTIQGNFIGTDRSGRRGLGNRDHGVLILSGSRNAIGGPMPEDGNVITQNTASGVGIVGGTANQILRNSIIDNDMIGIDLGPSDGATANDHLDPDVGANNLQNFPMLTSAVARGSEVLIRGTLDSTAYTSVRLEFFASRGCDLSGCGEGQRFLGSSNLVTDPGGSASFEVTLSSTVAEGEAIVATATTAAGSTSEFSPCVAARLLSPFAPRSRRFAPPPRHER